MEKHFFIVQWIDDRYQARPISGALAASIGVGFSSLCVGRYHCEYSGDWFFYFVNDQLSPVQADQTAASLIRQGLCCTAHSA